MAKNVINENKKLTLALSYQNIIWVLIALNVLIIFLWRPWTQNSTSERTISVSGEATLEAEPDLFKFSPSYDLTDDNRESSLDKAAKLSTSVVDGLKELGVEDKDIKLSASSYDNWWYDQDEDTYHAYISLTVDVVDREFAQEVQDYLLTTNPVGQITPWPTFSDETQAQLENQARTEAIADAQAKAEHSAGELGAKVGKVVSVTEGEGFGGFPIYDLGIAETTVDESRASIPVQPGENEYNFSISVVFELI